MKNNTLFKKTFLKLSFLTLFLNTIIFLSIYLLLPYGYIYNIKKITNQYHLEIVELYETKQYDQVYLIEGIQLNIIDKSLIDNSTKALNPKPFVGNQRPINDLQVYRITSMVDNYEIITSRFYDDISDIRSAILLMIIPLSLITLLLSLLFSRQYAKKLSTPIKNLTNYSQQLAKLNFDIKYNHYLGDDEIKILENNIIELSNNLNTVLQQLKNDVDVVTKKEAMRRKSIATFSHELNTPLTILKGYNEIMINNIGNPNDYPDYLIQSNNVIDDIMVLIEEILLNAKIDDEDYQLNLTTFDLGLFINDLINKYPNTNFNFNYQKQINITTDKLIFYHIIKNLLDNAVNHSEQHSQIDILITDHKVTIKNKLTTKNTSNHGIGHTIINNGFKKLNLGYHQLQDDKYYTVFFII